MGRSTSTGTPGVFQASDGSFEVDAWYRKQRIRRRGFARHADAQDFLIARKGEIGLGLDPGERPPMTLDQGAAKWLDAKLGMPSWKTDAILLAPVVKECGSLILWEVSDDTVRPFVEHRLGQGRKHKTINNALDIVQGILNRAASQWRHPNGLTWITYPPRISRLDLSDQRPPRPISWAEQRRLIPELPPHLARMALFDLNTGLREEALCNLRWDWEVRVPLQEGLTVSVFVVPKRYVKGRRRERLLVCNSVAQSIIEGQRGLHQERVFTYARATKRNGVVPKQKAIESMNNTAWQAGRERAGLGDLHVHDLRHTVGMRLRDAGVGERTQDDILWHTSGGMTAHYAVAQVRELYEALEKIARPSADESANLLTVVREARMQEVPRKSPAMEKAA